MSLCVVVLALLMADVKPKPKAGDEAKLNGTWKVTATTFNGNDGGELAWSPDGTLIAYAQGSEPKYNFHSLNRLAVVPAAGGTPRVLTASLDRGTMITLTSPRAVGC